MQSINIVMPWAVWFFATALSVGMVYMLAVIFLGDVFGIDSDVDLEVDLSDTIVEALGISFNVVATFCVGVGAMGLVAALNDWSVLLTLLSSLLFGVLVSRVFQKALNFILRQQGGDSLSEEHLRGIVARVTVPTPAGHYGAALIERPERMKITIKHIHDTPLAKGDMVVIVGVVDGRWLVEQRE